jgi:hypothetical protein
MRRAVRRPVSLSITSLISSSVCSEPFISASTWPSRASATATLGGGVAVRATLIRVSRCRCRIGFGDLADLRLGADQGRHDQAAVARQQGAACSDSLSQGWATAIEIGVRPRVISSRCSKRALRVSDSLKSGRLGLGPLDLLGRRQHLGRAGDHLLAVLVGAGAVEDHVLVARTCDRR